jgi:hypothetical protein
MGFQYDGRLQTKEKVMKRIKDMFKRIHLNDLLRDFGMGMFFFGLGQENPAIITVGLVGVAFTCIKLTCIKLRRQVEPEPELDLSKPFLSDDDLEMQGTIQQTPQTSSLTARNGIFPLTLNHLRMSVIVYSIVVSFLPLSNGVHSILLSVMLLSWDIVLGLEVLYRIFTMDGGYNNLHELLSALPTLPLTFLAANSVTGQKQEISSTLLIATGIYSATFAVVVDVLAPTCRRERPCLV